MSESKSKLIALVFDDSYKADEAKAAMNRMNGEGLLEIDETAVITKKEDGRVKVSLDFDLVAKNPKPGLILDLVTAAVTGTSPFLLSETHTGQLQRRLTDHGATRKFVKEVAEELQPGTSVLVFMTRSEPERQLRVVERLRIFDPKVLGSNLPPELEREPRQPLPKNPVNLL